MDCTKTHDARTTAPAIAIEPPQIDSLRAQLLDGLASVPTFSAAIGRSERTVYNWIERGLPTFHIGRTPYIPIVEARAWLLKPSSKNSPARAPGRPRKAA